MTDVIIKNIRDLLLYNKKVTSLTQDREKSHEQNLILQENLPKKLSQFCQLIQYQNGTLIIRANSGSAATQLRFLQQKLTNSLKKHSQFSALNTIKIKVADQPLKLDRAYTRTVKAVSERNRNLLRETANNLADQDLASSMRNLANTLENYGRD